MAKIRPLAIRRKESSAGKWFFIIVLAGIAVGGYLRRDDLMQKFHDMVHGKPVESEQPAPLAAAPAPVSVPAPVAVAPVPAPVAATRVSTPDNPCGAYAADASAYAACQDRLQKLQRMKDAASARDKAFLPPAAPPPGQQPATNTTAP